VKGAAEYRSPTFRGARERETAHNRWMSQRFKTLRPGVALLALGLFATACASTSTQMTLPGRTLALIDLQYPESQMTGVAMAPGEETPTARMSRSLIRELGRDGRFQVVDARGAGVRPAELGKDAAKTAALLRGAPADAYLGVRLLDCAARAVTETERRGTGASAVDVTVYLFRGECTAELTAFDPTGKNLLVLQKSGRWDSPRQDRPDSTSMQSQALTNAVDDTARRIARELKPATPGQAVAPAAAPAAK
jgi:hypothetical protein